MRLRSGRGAGKGGYIAAFCERYTYMQRELQPRRARSLQRRVISAYVTSVCAIGERVRVTVCVIALRFRFVSLFTGVFSSPAVLPRFAWCVWVLRACVPRRALKSWRACAHARAHPSEFRKQSLIEVFEYLLKFFVSMLCVLYEVFFWKFYRYCNTWSIIAEKKIYVRFYNK